jgi:hypothetical protein
MSFSSEGRKEIFGLTMQRSSSIIMCGAALILEGNLSINIIQEVVHAGMKI